MTVYLVTNEKIAETSSKGNQEKWYDPDSSLWYKLDQFGYEALAETVISVLLEQSSIESNTPFHFARYQMERLHVHGHDRTGCSSRNFLHGKQSIITLSHIFNRELGYSLKKKLEALSSDKKRIAYIAEATAEITGLKDFPQYLTLLFEIDALFLNDDRHLNNIAVLEESGKFDYCPVFDNGAGLLSNTQMSPMDVAPKALITTLRARPFNTSFTRQRNTVQNLYGAQLHIPQFSEESLTELITPMLEYYPMRDRGFILDRIVACILTRQK